MYKIIELIINMNGNFQGEILLYGKYSDKQFPFQGRYEFFQDSVNLIDLFISDEYSNYLDIPNGFEIELKREIKKYHGK